MFSEKEELMISKIESICAGAGYVKAAEVELTIVEDAVKLAREARKQNKVVWKKQARDSKGRFLTYEGANAKKYTQAEYDAAQAKAYIDGSTFTQAQIMLSGSFTQAQLDDAVSEAVEIAMQGTGDKKHDCIEAIGEAFLAGMNGRGNTLLLPSKKLELYLHSKGLK